MNDFADIERLSASKLYLWRNAATKLMSSRLDRVKDLEGLAEVAGFSVSGLASRLQCTPRHLRRYCAKRFRMTAEHWLQELRLRRAASELQKGEPVKRASAIACYQHASSFSRAFHQFYKQCPRDFGSP